MILVSLSELKENIVENLIKIGVDSKVRECTFLDSIKEELNEVFTNNNINRVDKYINCVVDKNTITFNLNNEGTRVEVELKAVAKDKFLIVLSSISKKEITVYEKVIDLNERTITTNQAICDYRNMEMENNNKSMVINKSYDEDGIMTSYVITQFKPNNIVSGLNQNYREVILHIPHSYKESDFWKNNYLSKVQLQREYLDIASLDVEFKETGMLYSSTVRLATVNGLRDMVLPDEVRTGLPKDYTIEPLSNEEIEDLINENIEHVRMGLKKYIKDRNTFQYNSKLDPNFKHEIRR